MNYYEHHIGDYAEATAHLSFVEDAAYSRLIRKYYSIEKPLPADIKSVQRLVGARTKEEKEAIQTILEEFFELLDDGWHNGRCDSEIARYKDKQAKAKRSADARWNKQNAHSEGNANASANAMRTHSEGNAHQAPSTRHQSLNPLSVAAASEPEPVGRENLPTAADAITERAIEITAMLRKRGASLQASNPVVRSWAERGVSDAVALTALEVAEQRRADSASSAAINAGLLNTIIGDMIATPSARASPGLKRKTIHDQRADTIAALTGANRNERTNAEPRDITAESVRIA